MGVELVGKLWARAMRNMIWLSHGEMFRVLPLQHTMNLKSFHSTHKHHWRGTAHSCDDYWMLSLALMLMRTMERNKAKYWTTLPLGVDYWRSFRCCLHHQTDNLTTVMKKLFCRKWVWWVMERNDGVAEIESFAAVVVISADVGDVVPSFSVAVHVTFVAKSQRNYCNRKP